MSKMHQMVVVGHGATAVVGEYGYAEAGDDGYATAGDHGHAKAGCRGDAKVGNHGYAEASYDGEARAGHYGYARAPAKAVAGDYGHAVSEKLAVAGRFGRAVTGIHGRAIAGKGGTVEGDVGASLCIEWWDAESGKMRETSAIIRADGVRQSAVVGHGGILPHVPYRLSADGSCLEPAISHDGQI